MGRIKCRAALVLMVLIWGQLSLLLASATFSSWPLSWDELAVSFNSVPCRAANNTDHTCPSASSCFCKPKWSTADLLQRDNLTFSEKYGLMAHIFEPPASDQRPARPAIVVIHGGGFHQNDRNEPKHIKLAQMLASQGYVTASIDYRLMGQDNTTYSNLIAAYDARAAIRWMRANAGRLRIDPTRIGAFGGSAGGMTVAVLASYPGEGDGGNPGFSSNISAAVSLSGILRPEFASEVGPLTVPFIDFHGCADHTVNYEYATLTVDTMRSLGAPAELYSFEGAGHVPFDRLEEMAPWSTLSAFFASHLDLAHAECP